ncbi:MAG: hypothetical protein ACXWC8_12620 [Limisphaerales bacterium]
MKTLPNPGFTALLFLACSSVWAASAPLDALKFKDPRSITNPYLPLASLKQDVLEGTEGGHKIRIERTAKPDVRKTFTIGDKTIESLAVEDREIKDGELEEVAMDYFAQADDGTVLYLGEDVNEYKDGKVVSHEGSWLLGKDTKTPGVIMPARPRVGAKFKSEDVNQDIHEEDEVIAGSENVTVPAGSYQNCIKVKETLADGDVEYKYFAFGIGCVREVPKDGNVVLISHSAKSKAEMRAEAEAKAQANAQAGQSKKKVVQDSLAREAMALVGVDPAAEKYWMDAINDPSLPKSERQDLVDDLNEGGFPDPHHPTPEDIAIIMKRLDLLERLGDKVPPDLQSEEVIKDLRQMGRVATGSREKID